MPRLEMAAQQSIDATVVQLDGTPQVTYRGVDGEPQGISSTYIRGYQPMLSVGTGVEGERKVLPYNLVTRWFWVDQESGQEIAADVLAPVWVGEDGYDEEIMLTFDANRDGQLDPLELRLDDYPKIALIKARLRQRGVKNPEIRGEIRAYHIHHNVRRGDLVNRDCTRCHSKKGKDLAAFRLSPYQPGSIRPSLVTDVTDVVLDGEFVVNDEGVLLLAPDHDVVHSYKAHSKTARSRK